MSAPNPAGPPAGVPGKKKTSPWIFVLLGCGGIIIIGGVIMVALGFFAVQKAKEAGFDPELLSEQPAVAVAKMYAAANPDVELVDVDKDGERITFREVKTGKTVTVSLEDVKNGKIVFESDEGEKMVLGTTGEGGKGGVKMETSEGSYEMGASASTDVPSWVPSYPGADYQPGMAARTPEGRSGTVTLRTSDSVEDVTSFFESALKDAGLKVNVIRSSGESQGGVITGESAGNKRSAMVTVGESDGSTAASVTYTEKN